MTGYRHAPILSSVLRRGREPPTLAKSLRRRRVSSTTGADLGDTVVPKASQTSGPSSAAPQPSKRAGLRGVSWPESNHQAGDRGAMSMSLAQAVGDAQSVGEGAEGA